MDRLFYLKAKGVKYVQIFKTLRFISLVLNLASQIWLTDLGSLLPADIRSNLLFNYSLII